MLFSTSFHKIHPFKISCYRTNLCIITYFPKNCKFYRIRMRLHLSFLLFQIPLTFPHVYVSIFLENNTFFFQKLSAYASPELSFLHGLPLCDTDNLRNSPPRLALFQPVLHSFPVRSGQRSVHRMLPFLPVFLPLQIGSRKSVIQLISFSYLPQYSRNLLSFCLNLSYILI